jgi:NADH-quinone oxidoreductase subunit I
MAKLVKRRTFADSRGIPDRQGLVTWHFFQGCVQQAREHGSSPSYPEEKRVYRRFRGVTGSRTAPTARRAAWRACAQHGVPRNASIRRPVQAGRPAPRLRALPAVFVIDELRCIFCGYCVEACPCDAIAWTPACTCRRAPPQYPSTRDADVDARQDGTFLTANPRHNRATSIRPRP